MAREKHEQVFVVTSPARLVLGNIRGPLVVRPGEAGQVTVTAVVHTDTGDAARTQVELTQAGDGTVHAVTHFDHVPSLFRLDRPCHVEYAVRVPGSCALLASNVEGALEVSGLEGTFDLSTVSGDVVLRDLSGVVRVQTVSGVVTGERLNLTHVLDFETVSGDVQLADCHLPAVHGSTVSGTLTTDTPLGAGPYAFHSVSGDIRLHVPGESACTAVITSLSGRIHTDLPMRGDRRPHRQRRGGKSRLDVNGGGTPIRLDSVSGDLSILRAGPAA